MRTITCILSALVLVCCHSSSTLSKEEAYRLLPKDTELLSAIAHFSVLVNPDSLPNNNNAPVLFHVALSKDDCFITATRRHEQYPNAEIIGESECNGYRVIFHSDGTTRSSRVLRKVQLKDTDYIIDDRFDPEIWEDGQLYDKNTYVVWFKITKGAKLKYNLIIGRSPEEMLEWGIDIRERAKNIK